MRLSRLRAMVGPRLPCALIILSLVVESVSLSLHSSQAPAVEQPTQRASHQQACSGCLRLPDGSMDMEDMYCRKCEFLKKMAKEYTAVQLVKGFKGTNDKIRIGDRKQALKAARAEGFSTNEVASMPNLDLEVGAEVKAERFCPRRWRNRMSDTGFYRLGQQTSYTFQADVTCLNEGVSGKSAVGVGIKVTYATPEALRDSEFMTNVFKHPNVLRAFDSEILEGSADSARQRATIMELPSGGVLCNTPELGSNKAITCQKVSPLDTKRLLFETMEGLSHLHKNDIVHGNVRPDNVFLVGDCDGSSKGCHAKLANFAVACSLPDEDCSLAAGELRAYDAPERAATDNRTLANDIWSFGVMAYTLVTGSPPPFLESYFNGTADKVQPELMHYTRNPRFPAPLNSFFRGTLQVNPQARISAKHALKLLTKWAYHDATVQQQAKIGKTPTGRIHSCWHWCEKGCGPECPAFSNSFTKDCKPTMEKKCIGGMISNTCGADIE